MIDCDVCHRWFHGSCLGVVTESAAALPYWRCDDCAMRAQVEVQRERLSAASGSRDAMAGATSTEASANQSKSCGYT